MKLTSKVKLKTNAKTDKVKVKVKVKTILTNVSVVVVIREKVNPLMTIVYGKKVLPMKIFNIK